MAGEKPVAGMVLSVVAGILILGNAALYFAASEILEALGPIPGVEELGFDLEALLITMGAVGVALGVLILLFGIIMFVRPGLSTAMGVLVLVFSLISIIAGGGFFVGLVLGLVGGILGIVFKPTPVAPAYPSPPAPPPTE